jgi:aminopeptidase N
LRIYYNEHKDSTATTEDLRNALERASGKNLKVFFDRWIYKAGHPIYQVTWKNAGAGKLVLTLRQTQPDGAFLQPVTLEIQTNSGKRRVTLTPTGKETTITVRNPEPKAIIIDPDEFILKEVVN